MKKFISLCIIAAMLTVLFSSCANPPGSKPSSDTLPQPGDQPETEKVVAEPEPVDLSGLTEEELGKIENNLIEKLKTTAFNDTVKIDVRLRRPMDTHEFNVTVDARVKYNTEKREEISKEINELENRKDSLAQKSSELANDSNSTLITEINEKIKELNEEYEVHDPVYNNCVNQVFAAEFRPLLDEFMERHDLDSEGTSCLTSFMTVEDISTTPSKIMDIAKDIDVVYISCPEEIYYHGHDLSLTDGQTPPVSDYEVNQIYNLIDGEIAVSAGDKGNGIVIGMVESGVPDNTVVSGVTYCGSDSTNITQHATNVAKIIKKNGTELYYCCFQC